MFPSPDYRHFNLSGTHHDIGAALGRATERFAVPAWWPPPPDLEFAQACESEIGSLNPPLVEELRAYAEAQGVKYEVLLRGICRQRMKTRFAPRVPEGGCSTLATQSEDGHVIVGHNYDFYTVQRIRQRIRLSPATGLASLGTRGSVPGGRHDGVNAAGLFVGLHVVLADEPERPAPGVPYHLIPRIVLETCASTREAREVLTRLPHLHSFNYLVADSSGDMFVAEAHPEAIRFVEPESVDGRPALSATNHFEHPELRPRQARRRLDHSRRRREALLARAGTADYATLDRLLADHASGLCGHTGGHTTLWSLAADLTARRIAYARGAPCKTPFETIAWPGEPS